MKHNLLFLATYLCIAVELTAADWPRFRGVNGAGTSDEKGLPLEWTTTKNVIWKTALPGYGASSPIIIGKDIFLTCYSGYGLGDEKSPGDKSQLRHHVLCLDADTGKLKWNQSVAPRQSPRPNNETDYVGFTAK